MTDTFENPKAGKSLSLAAHVVSYVFNPLLMPIWAFLILFSQEAHFSTSIPHSAKRMLLTVVVINATLLPLLAIIMLKRLGLVSSLDLDKREERLYPLLLGVIMYTLTFFLFQRLGIDQIYPVFLMGAGFIAGAGLMVSLFFKVSIHMAAVGGLFGLLFMLEAFTPSSTLSWLLIVTLACGLTGSARLVLNAHSPAQVYLGFIMGICMMSLSFLIN